MTALNVNTHNLFSTESLPWLSHLGSALRAMSAHFLGRKVGKMFSDYQKLRVWGFFLGQTGPDRTWAECSAAILAARQRYLHLQHLTVRPSGILLLQPRRRRRSVPSCGNSFIFTMALTFSWRFLRCCWPLFLTELLPGLLCLQRLNYHQILAFHEPLAKKVLPKAGKLVLPWSKPPLGRIQAST